MTGVFVTEAIWAGPESGEITKSDKQIMAANSLIELLPIKLVISFGKVLEISSEYFFSISVLPPVIITCVSILIR